MIQMEQYVKAYIAYLTIEEQASENTIASYRRDLLKLCGYFEKCGIQSLEDVTHTNLTSYILEMECNSLAASSISRSLSAIRSFFSYLTEQRVIEKNVSKKLSSPKVTPKKPEILDPFEVEAYLGQTFPNTKKGVRDQAMIELLFATGMRVSELIALQVTDLDYELGCVMCGVNDPKRVVPVESIALGFVKKYVDEVRPDFDKKGNSHLFLNYAGNALTRQGIWKVLRAYGTSAGITKEITPHMIRHTFASNIVNNGADLKAVQEMMGHADLATTQSYVDKKKHLVMEEYKKSFVSMRPGDNK